MPFSAETFFKTDIPEVEDTRFEGETDRQEAEEALGAVALFSVLDTGEIELVEQ